MKQPSRDGTGARHPGFSPEFQLAVACCLWPPGERRAAAVEAALSLPMDWALFLRVVRRQRIAGLAFHALRSSGHALPPDTEAALHEDAAKVARHSLRFTAETARLSRMLHAGGVPVACLKGVTLSQLAFGQLALRHSRDIDLLVQPARVDEADALLQADGYRMTMPIALEGERHRRTWMRLRKHFEYAHPETGLQVELHWRLFDNEHLAATAARTSSADDPKGWQPVSIAGAGEPLFTLSRPDLLLYLCTHGANHMWFRLKWIADVHALLAAGGDDATGETGELARLLQDARALHTERAVLQALQLSHLLFGEPQPPSELEHGSAVAGLVSSALRAMTAGDAATELEEVPFGTSRVALARYRLRRDWRFWIDEARSGLLDEKDRASSGLPPSLNFLLPLLRVPLWITRRVAGLGRSNR